MKTLKLAKRAAVVGGASLVAVPAFAAEGTGFVGAVTTGLASATTDLSTIGGVVIGVTVLLYIFAKSKGMIK